MLFGAMGLLRPRQTKARDLEASAFSEPARHHGFSMALYGYFDGDA